MKSKIQKDKVKNMLLYFSSEIPGITSIKLQKAMLLADRYNWATAGSPISGLQYVKKDFGPVMERGGQTILSALDNGGAIDVAYKPMPNDCEKVMRTARVKADRSFFSDAEWTSLAFARDYVSAHTTEELSTMTHDDAWGSVGFDEVIPYETSVHIDFSADEEPNEEETARVFKAAESVDFSALVAEAI